MEAGSVDGGVAAWCRRRLDSEPVQVLFRAGYLSQVTGLRLADGRAVVLKARPPAPRLHGCVALQATLAAAGFPCPRPLAGPAPLGALAATAEELVPGGHLLAPGPAAAGRFAALLAELVRLAPDPAALPTLAPSPPWAAWDHDLPGLWPPPDDRPGDLNADPGPPWLDRVAAAVRTRLAELRLPPVAGHADWESQNLRWDGDRPLAVHDWDSAVAQPEAVVAGLACGLAGRRRPGRGGHRRAVRAVPHRLRAGPRPPLDGPRTPGLLGRRPVGPCLQRQEGAPGGLGPPARPSRRAGHRAVVPGRPRRLTGSGVPARGGGCGDGGA